MKVKNDICNMGRASSWVLLGIILPAGNPFVLNANNDHCSCIHGQLAKQNEEVGTNSDEPTELQNCHSIDHQSYGMTIGVHPRDARDDETLEQFKDRITMCIYDFLDEVLDSAYGSWNADKLRDRITFIHRALTRRSR